MKFFIKDLSSKCDEISAVSCGFGHIYWRNTYWKTSFFFAVIKLQKPCVNGFIFPVRWLEDPGSSLCLMFFTF